MSRTASTSTPERSPHDALRGPAALWTLANLTGRSRTATRVLGRLATKPRIGVQPCPRCPQRRSVTSGVWDIEAIRNCTHEFEYAPPPPRLSTGTLCPTFPAYWGTPTFGFCRRMCSARQGSLGAQKGPEGPFACLDPRSRLRVQPGSEATSGPTSPPAETVASRSR